MLFLNNITEEKTGVYNCTVRSHNLSDTGLITLKLKENFKPGNISLTSNKENNIAFLGDEINLTCSAYGSPKPNYEISLNGSVLGDAVGGMFIINSVNLDQSGEYTCLATNFLGTASLSLFLVVKVPSLTVQTLSSDPTYVALGTTLVLTAEYTYEGNSGIDLIWKSNSGKKLLIKWTKSDGRMENADSRASIEGQANLVLRNTTLSDNGTFILEVKGRTQARSLTISVIVLTLENSELIKRSNTTEWYPILIGLLCGILSGIILVFSIQWLQRRLKRQNNNSTSSERGPIPQVNYHEGVDNVSDYAELNQQTRNVDDNYQPLKTKSRLAKNNEAPPAQESDYQELNVVMGPDKASYQSLNRV